MVENETMYDNNAGMYNRNKRNEHDNNDNDGPGDGNGNDMRTASCFCFDSLVLIVRRCCHC